MVCVITLMVGTFFVKSNPLVVLGTVGALAALACLGGCGGVSTETDGERTTTTVIVECVIEGEKKQIEFFKNMKRFF